MLVGGLLTVVLKSARTVTVGNPVDPMNTNSSSVYMMRWPPGGSLRPLVVFRRAVALISVALKWSAGDSQTPSESFLKDEKISKLT